MNEPKKVLWASTGPLTAPTGRSVGTPRKYTRVVHAPPLRAPRARMAAVLLVLGAGLEIGSIFPQYGEVAQGFPTFLTGKALSLGAILEQLVPVAPWLLAAVLVARARPGSLRAGAGLAAAAVALASANLLLSVGQLVHQGVHAGGPGLWLALGGALVALVAVILVVAELTHTWMLGRFGAPSALSLFLAVVGGAAWGAASAPGWLVYHIKPVGSPTQSDTIPGGFSNPWPVMAAQVVVIAVVAAAVLVALAWTGRAAAGVAFGLGVALLGRAAATVVRRIDGITPQQVGSSASQVRVWIDFNDWIWVGAAGLLALGLLTLYLLVRPNEPESVAPVNR